MSFKLTTPKTETIKVKEEKNVVDLTIIHTSIGSSDPLDPGREYIQVKYRKGYDNGGETVWSPEVYEKIWRSQLASPILEVNQAEKEFVVDWDAAQNFGTQDDKLLVAGSTGNDGIYTVDSVELDNTDPSRLRQIITVKEAIPDSTADGVLFGDGYQRMGSSYPTVKDSLRIPCYTEIARIEGVEGTVE